MTLFSPGYQPVAATRVLDTLAGLGVTKAQLSAGSTTSVKVTGTAEVAGAGVAAVVVHVTASLPAASTALTIWEKGTVRPSAPTLVVTKSTDTPNETYAVVRPDASGGISLYNSTAKTDVALDIVGWFPVGSPIETVPTTRIVDSQTGLGVRNVALGVGESTAFTALGRGGVPSSGVGSLMLLVTAVNPSAATSLTVYPNGTTRPAVASLLAPRRLISSNLVLVPPATDGTVRIHNLAGSSHVTVDVVAWLSASDATRYRPITPTRVATARRVALAATSTVDITAGGSVPSSGVGAVVLGITALPLTLPRKGYPTITAWAAGATRPAAPSITVRSLKSRLMTVVVEPGTGGVSLYAAGAGFDVSVDVLGWLPARTSDVTVTPGSVIADAGDVVAVDATSGGGGTVRVAAGLPVPAVGGHYGVMPQSLAPDGVLGTVTAVQAHSDGSKTLVLGPATLTDVFSDFRYAYAGPLRSGPVGAAALTGASMTQALSCGTTAGLSPPTLGATIDDGEFVLEYGAFGRHLKVLVNGSLTASVAGDVAVGFSCTVEFPLVTVPIAAFTLDLQPSISVDVSLSGAFKWGAATQIPFSAGFEYLHGNLDNLTSVDLQSSGTIDSEFGASLTASGSLYARVALFGLVGGGISAGLEVTGSVAPETLPCASLTAGFVVSFPVTVGRWGLDWTITIASVRSPTVTLYQRLTPCPIPLDARLIVHAEQRRTVDKPPFDGSSMHSEHWHRWEDNEATSSTIVVHSRSDERQTHSSGCPTPLYTETLWASEGFGPARLDQVASNLAPGGGWSLSPDYSWVEVEISAATTGWLTTTSYTDIDCYGAVRELTSQTSSFLVSRVSFFLPVGTLAEILEASTGTTFSWQGVRYWPDCFWPGCYDRDERSITVTVGAPG